jgi:hypothetical protein
LDDGAYGASAPSATGMIHNIPPPDLSGPHTDWEYDTQNLFFDPLSWFFLENPPREMRAEFLIEAALSHADCNVHRGFGVMPTTASIRCLLFSASLRLTSVRYIHIGMPSTQGTARRRCLFMAFSGDRRTPDNSAELRQLWETAGG